MAKLLLSMLVTLAFLLSPVSAKFDTCWDWQGSANGEGKDLPGCDIRGDEAAVMAQGEYPALTEDGVEQLKGMPYIKITSRMTVKNAKYGNTRNIGDCCYLCRRLPSCTNYVFDENEKVCYLKNCEAGAAAIAKWQPREGFWSGTTEGPGDVTADGTVINSSCETGKDISGNDIEYWCTGTFCFSDPEDGGGNADFKRKPMSKSTMYSTASDCAKGCAQQAQATSASTSYGEERKCDDVCKASGTRCSGGGGNHPTWDCYNGPCAAVTFNEDTKECYYKSGGSPEDRSGFTACTNPSMSA